VRLGIWISWSWKQQRMVSGYIPLGLPFNFYSFSEQVQDKFDLSHVAFQGLAVLLFLIGIL